MSQQQKTVLVTGFGPFPGASDNPSQQLIEAMSALAGPCASEHSGLYFQLLSTDWHKLPHEHARAFERTRPDLSVHLGYSRSSPGFQLETTAFNETCALVDVAGQAGPCGSICNDTPAKLTTTLPLEKLQDELTTCGLNACLSNDPGRYLCNMAYYLALQHFSRGEALFVHIPALQTGNRLLPQSHEGGNVLTVADAQKGLGVILDTLRRS